MNNKELKGIYQDGINQGFNKEISFKEYKKIWYKINKEIEKISRINEKIKILNKELI